MNGLAICAGVGGLELGLKLAIPKYRTVCYIEREAYAASVLVARMEDAALDRAPIWDDLTTFPGGVFRGGVDLIAGGFPCQPFSLAGACKAEADPRTLWPHVERLIRDIRPRLVFLENVPGLLSSAVFEQIQTDLAILRYDVTWDCISAASVGAPHGRERLFTLAALPDADGEGQLQPSGGLGQGGERAGYSSWWATEPDVGRVAYGVAGGMDRIRAIGNGVVPLAAAHAFRVLYNRLK